MNAKASEKKSPKRRVEERQFDYIIVGSGAGGAPLAARLATHFGSNPELRHKRVLVIEAGSNHTEKGPRDPGNEISRVPILHAASSEHEDLAWRFFVDHYEQEGKDRPDGIQADPKWHKGEEGDSPQQEQTRGIFYPRAAGVGGCTIHNAMITIAGPSSDWDELASFLGDSSWSGQQMRAYFKKLEHNDYLEVPDRARQNNALTLLKYFRDGFRFLFGRHPDSTSGDHGFDGWLHTSFTDLSIGLTDKQLIEVLATAVRQSKRYGLDSAVSFVRSALRGRFTESLDPNHSETQSKSPEGVVMIPLAVHGKRTTIHQNREQPYAMPGRRSSPRELLLRTQSLYPNNLEIWTDCLVTQVVVEEDSKGPTKFKATGVEYRKGKNLYRAHIKPSEEVGEKAIELVRENGEVILCGGSFNTPQLLMLSGIGPKEEIEPILKNQAGPKRSTRRKKKDETGMLVGAPDHFINLPGVGKNLQDRYEVSVISEMKKDFELLEGATMQLPTGDAEADQHLQRWRDEGSGLYTSNGPVIGIFKRSNPHLVKPDLFIFGVPSYFRGYEVGYSNPSPKNLFTWVILKSHTRNRAGYVKLRTFDPRDRPVINFNYFGTGPDRRVGDHSSRDPDVKAIVEGVKFVRRIADKSRSVVREIHPGVEHQSDTDTNAWIRRDAWGHHACGTCRMGPDGDKNAVLDSRFRVRDGNGSVIQGLRVVDASIFPKIPGYFIATNIYMASEKAADVIIEDASKVRADVPWYPTELRTLEEVAIGKRRDMLGRSMEEWTAHESVSEFADESKKTLAESAGDAVDMDPIELDAKHKEKAQKKNEELEAIARNLVTEAGHWKSNVTGLALSGGGIRSATLCLGVLQGLARGKKLREIDFLSTVSGGGYIGSFLGRFYNRLRDQGIGKSPADQVEEELNRADSPVVQWLRSHGNYIYPTGSGDGRLAFATYFRNFLSVHLVIGLAAFAIFGIANAFRFGLVDKVLVGLGLVLNRADLPLGYLLQSLIGPWFSPWFMLVELVFLFLVLPQMIGYWIVSPERHEAFKRIPLLALFLISGGLLHYGIKDGLQVQFLVVGLACLSALIHVEKAWMRGRSRERSVGTGGESTQRARTRNYLTYDLGLAFALCGAALFFTIVDSLGFALQEWKVAGNFTYARAFASLATTLAAGIPIARWIAGFISRQQNKGRTPFLGSDLFASVLAVVLILVPMIFFSFAAHAAYQSGITFWRGLSLTLVATVLTILFAAPSAIGFVNRSSLSQTYAARLGRAYLGASNPARHRPEGINITEVIPGDDVGSIREYRPHEAAGPFHILNLVLNQTLDSGSRLRKRDRKGLSLAISSLAVSVGERWHSVWVNPSDAAAKQTRRQIAGLKAIGRMPGKDHPLVNQLDLDADRAEVLSLRQVMAISGAAVDPGGGKYTRLGTSLLMGLVNLRTGYWWDTGMAAAARSGFPKISFIRRFLYLIPRLFGTQCLLLFEWMARFPGPWHRFWHISDGGYFENTGAYELIRRQVPRIIVCDGSADPNYEFSDLGELIRKVRIDFAARIEPFSKDDIEGLKLTPELNDIIGPLEQLKPKRDAAGNVVEKSQRHASLFWVHYSNDPDSRPSIMLFFKATVTGDEPEDVQNYHLSHPDFPHESTADQFFDEAQWESYRKLGEHFANMAFKDDWFWKINLPKTTARKNQTNPVAP